MDKLLILLSFLSLSAHAIEMTFTGACSALPLLTVTERKVDLDKSLGALTLEILEDYAVSFVGNEEGFNSLFETPTGLDALELVDETTLRAHGWCFTLDGALHEFMPHESFVPSQDSKIHWFFGYSTNIKNEWFGYCDPTWPLAPTQFCE